MSRLQTKIIDLRGQPIALGLIDRLGIHTAIMRGLLGTDHVAPVMLAEVMPAAPAMLAPSPEFDLSTLLEFAARHYDPVRAIVARIYLGLLGGVL